MFGVLSTYFVVEGIELVQFPVCTQRLTSSPPAPPPNQDMSVPSVWSSLPVTGVQDIFPQAALVLVYSLVCVSCYLRSPGPVVRSLCSLRLQLPPIHPAAGVFPLPGFPGSTRLPENCTSWKTFLSTSLVSFLLYIFDVVFLETSFCAINLLRQCIYLDL